MSTIAPTLSLPTIDSQERAVAMKAAKAKNVEGIKAAAKGFEAMYMREMLSHMWEGIETNDTFGGGKGEEVFRSMMIDEYGKMIADSGQTKIADTLTREILRMQEEQRNPRGTIIRNPGETHE